MSDLSHDDIDALLDEAEVAGAGTPAAGDPGALEEPRDGAEAPLDSRNLQVFDFQQPHSLNKAFDRTVRGICESFTKVASLAISNIVRANCVFTFGGLKLSTFADAFAPVDNPCCICVVEMRPLKGAVLVTIDAGLMFSLFTKLLGGPIEVTGQIRDFTDIEIHLARKLVTTLLEQFEVAAAKVIELDIRLEQIENNPNYLNVFNDGETVLNLHHTVALEEATGALRFFIPLSAFEPVREAFDPSEARRRRPQDLDGQDRRKAVQSLSETTAHVSVRIGDRTVSLEELTQLGVNDVIALGHPVDRPLDVAVEGTPMFEAVAGQRGPARAVRIVTRKEVR